MCGKLCLKPLNVKSRLLAETDTPYEIPVAARSTVFGVNSSENIVEKMEKIKESRAVVSATVLSARRNVFKVTFGEVDMEP
jgi:Tat protein secretion system quality control protein TatD with DNase activity